YDKRREGVGLSGNRIMQFNADRVRRNVTGAETLYLLDRVTAYREGMEPEALVLIEEELRRRGVSSQDIQAHAEHVRRTSVQRDDGRAARCSFCSRPAVERRCGWHRLWRVLPLFPRPYYYCAGHRPGEAAP